MTTIILTIIGILLAAAAALMVIFYGGDAFNSGTTGAAASTIQNAGTNVIAAVVYYKNENGSYPAANWTAFVAASGAGGAYLNAAPSLPASYSQSLNPGGQYVISGVPDSVCQRINVNLKNPTANSSSATNSRTLICIPNATAGSPGTFYANA